MDVPNEVLRRWGLEGCDVELLTGGATNMTWRVSWETGVGVLRRYRTTDLAAVVREHHLITHAVAAGVRNPSLIADLDRSTVVQCDGGLFALFELASGTQLQPTDLEETHAAAAGRFLAALHQATIDVPIDEFRTWSLDWDGDTWAERVRTTAEHIPTHSASETDRWALRRSIEQADWLDDPACGHRYVPTSSAQVIHGDFQHANLFFDTAREDGEVSAVIDWDTAAAMPRGFEVVRACSFMFQVDPERTRAFVDGYRSVMSLSADELADGARAWGCFADHHVWPLEERYLNGNPAAERFIPHAPFQPFAELWAAAAIH